MYNLLHFWSKFLEQSPFKWSLEVTLSHNNKDAEGTETLCCIAVRGFPVLNSKGSNSVVYEHQLPSHFAEA